MRASNSSIAAVTRTELGIAVTVDRIDMTIDILVVDKAIVLVLPVRALTETTYMFHAFVVRYDPITVRTAKCLAVRVLGDDLHSVEEGVFY